ncbi:MFS transporter [Nonomuraea sp. NPDC050663]|uniref:MFS transporter n=1 Tax=Nonomuraea sp. NPDC050663 TaxID=3364370 RepID=UPI0037A1B940
MTLSGRLPPDPHTNRPGRASSHWLVLAVLALAQVMVVLDATVVNIALPSAQADLDFDDSQRQWLITGYALSFGSLLLIGGRLADLFGRKQAFVAGVIGFAIASVAGGAAGSFEVLVAARVGQGVFAALLAPASLALLTTTFTEADERARAFGVFGAISGAGGAIGLLLGGALTQYLDWRWCMYINVVIAAFALIGGLALLKSSTPTERPRLDLVGVSTATAGMFALVFGLANAHTDAWSAPSTWGPVAGGAALLTSFVVWQSKVARPLLPLRILLHRNRGGSFLAVFVLCAGMFAIFLFMTFYLQQNLGFGPVRTGLAFLPMILALMISATLGTTLLLPKVGPRLLVMAGMLVAAAGTAFMSLVNETSSYAADVLPGLIVAGLGLGLALSAGMNVGTAGVEEEDSGAASAAIQAVQQLGGSIGTALFSTIAASAFSDALGQGAIPSTAAISGYAIAFAWAAGLFAIGGTIAGLVLRSGIPDELTSAHPSVPA